MLGVNKSDEKLEPLKKHCTSEAGVGGIVCVGGEGGGLRRVVGGGLRKVGGGILLADPPSQEALIASPHPAPTHLYASDSYF